MFKRLADDVSLLLVTNNVIPSEHREFYIYGLELFFQKLALYFAILVIAVLTKTLLLSFVFVIAYTGLRRYTGGYHCKTAELCFIVSILIYLIMVLIYVFDIPQIETTLAITSLLSLPVILRFSPVESENNPLEDKEKEKYRKLSIIISLILTLAAAISFCLNLKVVFYSVAWSLSADAVLIILTLGRSSHEENNIEGDGNNG